MPVGCRCVQRGTKTRHDRRRVFVRIKTERHQSDARLEGWMLQKGRLYLMQNHRRHRTTTRIVTGRVNKAQKDYPTLDQGRE